MKKFSFISAGFAAAFIGFHLWIGPIYTKYDGCSCGLHRTWISFDDQPRLRDTKLFLRVTSSGDPSHKHEYIDPVYVANSALGFIGTGFGLVSVVLWFAPRKRTSQTFQ
jgi:hypothetical protein